MLETLTAFGTLKVSHERAYDFDEKRGLWVYKPVDLQLDQEDYHNLLTNAGRVALHTYAYGSAGQRFSGAGSSGFNYIALSTDSTAPSMSDSAPLTGETSGNGLTRALGTVTLPVSAGNQTVITKTFTYTGGGVTVQKTALFDDPTAGHMIHEIQFSARALQSADTLTVTFTLTVG